MPKKNVVKEYAPNAYYHVYNRGVAKMSIFQDAQDYQKFLSLIDRYLGAAPKYDNHDRAYPWINGEIELLSFCLMPNHFHLVVYQISQDSMARLIQGLCAAYTMYFNKKYKRVGGLFEGTYKAKYIQDDDHLLHITRYVHMNPHDFEHWEYSSLRYYVHGDAAAWLKPERIKALFDNAKEYYQFHKDYESKRDELGMLKNMLAND